MRDKTRNTQSLHKCWRHIVKKGVATMQIIAMTVALMGGYGTVVEKAVYAAETNVIQLNQPVEIDIPGGSVSYTFTTPEDGTYYFFTEGDYDTYGTLSGDGMTIVEDDDSGLSNNFIIEQYLEKDQVCTIKVKEYDGDELLTTLIVCDENSTGSYLGSSDSEYLYVNEGENQTLNIYDVAGNPMSSVDRYYDVEWYKCVEDGEREELETEDGASYFIENVGANDFYQYKGEYKGNYYACSLSIDEQTTYTKCFYLYEKDNYVELYGFDAYARLGESVSLHVEAYDNNGESIDINSNGYSAKWYKVVDDDRFVRTLVGENTLSYTVENVRESDFYDSYTGMGTLYECEIYRDDILIGSTSCYIYDKDSYLYVDGTGKYASTGERVELVVTAQDYEWNRVDLNSAEYTCKWYKEIINNDEDRELIPLEGNGSSYVISSVQASDFFDDYEWSGARYRCEVYKNGRYIDYANCYIYDKYSTYDGGYDTYWTVEGATIELKPVLYNYDYKRVNLEKEGYTFEWYKSREDSYDDEIIGRDYTYRIANVQQGDFCDSNNDYIEYACRIYRNGKYLATYFAGLEDKAANIRTKSQCIYASEGDTVTLIPSVYDYNGSKIDIYDSGLEIEWYRSSADDYQVVGNEPTYVIESLTAEDFSDVYYEYKVTNPSTGIGSYGNVYIYDASQGLELYSDVQCFYKKIGESVILEATLQAWNGVFYPSSKDYSFEWYVQYHDVENGGYVEMPLQSYESTYVIDELEESDMYDLDTERIYMCRVRKNGDDEEGYVSYAYIYNADYYANADTKLIGAIRGESVTLTTSAYDIDGNEIDLTGDEYEFVWQMYSYETEEWMMLGTDRSITIDSVNEEHYNAEIQCSIYRSNGEVCTQYFYLEEMINDTGAPIVEDNNNNNDNTGGAKPPQDTTKPGTSTNSEKVTTVAPTTKPASTATTTVKKPGKVKIKKINTKKKASKTVKLTLKKVKGAKGYQIQIAKDKKFKSKNILVKKYVKKLTSSITSKKLKNKKKLYVRVRAYVLNAKGKKVYGKWSTVKKVKIK